MALTRPRPVPAILPGFDAWIFEEADAFDSEIWGQRRQNPEAFAMTFVEAFLIVPPPSPPLVSESSSVGVFWMDDIDMKAHETLDGVTDAPCGQDDTFIQDLLARAAHRMERLRLADNWVTDADPTTE
jgi:hypothetical protein